MNNNYDTAMKYRNTPLSVQGYEEIHKSISFACRHYVLGRSLAIRRLRQPQGNCIAEACIEYGYTDGSIRRFIAYADAIDKLHAISREFVVLIMEERVRISGANIMWLVKKQPQEILHIFALLSEKKATVGEIFPSGKHRAPRSRALQTAATIKDVPPYDPDAQVISLSCTMPSWVGAMEKVFTAADFKRISLTARYRLRKELVVLLDTAEVVLGLLKEDV